MGEGGVLENGYGDDGYGAYKERAVYNNNERFHNQRSRFIAHENGNKGYDEYEFQMINNEDGRDHPTRRLRKNDTRHAPKHYDERMGREDAARDGWVRHESAHEERWTRVQSKGRR